MVSPVLKELEVMTESLGSVVMCVQHRILKLESLRRDANLGRHVYSV